MSRLRLAVIGVGHLGKEHARILAGVGEIDLLLLEGLDGRPECGLLGRLTRRVSDTGELVQVVADGAQFKHEALGFGVAARAAHRGRFGAAAKAKFADILAEAGSCL